MSTLRKWIYTTGGFPQCLKQKTYMPPSPSTLKPTEIQVSTRAFALNPVDVQAMNMHDATSPYLRWSPLSSPAAQPAERETCCDFSGTVTHAGADSGFRAGDDVFGFTLAPVNNLGTAGAVLTLDAAVASSSGVALAAKPAGWDHVHAAAVPLVWLTARTSIEAVREHVEAAGREADDRWLVVLGGASSTGMHTVRIAKARGWRVVATCSTRNVDFVRGALGADEVVDRSVASSVPGEIYAKLGDVIARGAGVVVVDCVGGTECLHHADLNGKISRYVTIVGDKTDRSSMGGPAIYVTHPKMMARWLLGRVGVGVSYDCVILEARKEWLEEAGRTLGKDEIVVDSTFKFDELPKALEKMVGGNVRGKLVGVLDKDMMKIQDEFLEYQGIYR